MNRTNAFLAFSLLGLCLLWFFWTKPTPEAEKKETPLVESSAFDEKKPIKTAPKAKAPVRDSKTPKKRSIEQSRPQTHNNFEIFKKQLKNEAFITIVENVAFAGGDQIVGFIEPDQEFDEGRFYKARVKESLLWTDSTVPFGYAERFPRGLKDLVERALAYFNQETGVRFVEFDETQDEDAVVFTFKPKLPCSSFVGRIGGLQQIFLNFDCGYQSVLHEIMHALGFVHEQQLPYRDDFVEILWENIEEDSVHNFSEAPEVWTKHYQGIGSDFDYKSVMIYSDTAFARPGKKSMSSATDALISPSTQGLSEIDLERLDALY